MSIDEWLSVLENSAIAHAISKSNHLVAASLQVVHVIGFITLLAALVLVSLRLLRWAFNDQSLADIAAAANRLVAIGLALVVASGVLMFVATPQLYFYKPAFELKMLLFAGALLLQFTLLRRMAQGSAGTWAVRTLVGLSLLTWFSIGFAGRMIGFT
jgi:hypothetical protein